MRLLLDTHAFIWAVVQPPRVGVETARLLADPTNEVLVSAVVAWEIAIKRSLGRLTFHADVGEQVAANRFSALPIGYDHAAAVEPLPALHADPFDRLLIAQAMVEDATIVTRDPKIARYDVPVHLA